MRFSVCVLLTLLLLSSAFRANAENNKELPSKDVQSVINIFKDMCTPEQPKFEQIEAKATAMSMQLKADEKDVLSGSVVAHSKAWEGELTTGPFGFFFEEISGPQRSTIGCAVKVDISDLDAFRIETISKLDLTEIRTPEVGADGSRSFVWNGIYGSESKLILRESKSSERSEITLHVLYMDRHQTVTTPKQLNDKELLNQRAEIAELEAKIAKEKDEFYKRPRRVFVGARYSESRYALYVDNCRKKIERVGEENYPKEAEEQKLYGKVQLTVSILRNGSVEKVEINKSSGYRVIDEAAERIVQLAAPFDPFPDNIRKDTDILSFTRTLTFSKESTSGIQQTSESQAAD